jgi:hypothetical protein
MLIIHLFANVGSFVVLLLGILVLSRFDDVTPPEYYIYSLVPIIMLFTFGRLLVLPIAYKKLENSQKFDLVAKFIQRLKQSWRLKIIVLIIAYFSFWAVGFPYFFGGFYTQLIDGIVFGFYTQLIDGIFFGLLGNYLVLYAYWFIEDKIKKIKQKHLH